MNVRRPSLKHLILLIALGLVGPVGGVSFAVQKKPVDQEPSRVSPKGHKVSADALEKTSTPKAMNAVRQSSPASKKDILPKPSLSAEASQPKKSHRAIKAHKKVLPKAVVQPRTDLIHYGILEDSQRYDPRPHADSAGVPSPQTSDLTHDHFQELDRNQDGKIDPVERAFGRIDMDRDLNTRTLH